LTRFDLLHLLEKLGALKPIQEVVECQVSEWLFS
jgi:hypothetical protein